MEGTWRLLKAGPCFLGLGIRSVLCSESMCDYIDNLLWWCVFYGFIVQACFVSMYRGDRAAYFVL